jgi:hypothetical protein
MAPAGGPNGRVLRVFGPVLILAGLGGFLLPPGPMSGAPAYNAFHIAFGALACALAFGSGERAGAAFNLGFGLIDLYQAAASRAHLFPEVWFRWKTADDVLHVVIGLGLVAVGALGLRRSAASI